jgi:hypothetical protein
MCIPGKGDRLWESGSFVNMPDEDATVTRLSQSI